MKLPQHPVLPVISVVCLAYLCGDLACALFERRFSYRPWVVQNTAAPVSSAAAANGRELEALLNWHSPVAGPVVEPTGAPDPEPRMKASVFPNLLGTMEGGGSALAILQMPGSSQPAVVALGDEFQDLKLVEVGAYEVRMRDKSGLEQTITMMSGSGAAVPPPAATPGLPQFSSEPYRTSRELRHDIDNKSQWIGHIMAQPVMRQGESVGVSLKYTVGENPFARLGIQSGDVVLSLNNKPAKAVEDLPELLMILRNSQTLIFQLERNGKPLTLTVNLDP